MKFSEARELIRNNTKKTSGIGFNQAREIINSRQHKTKEGRQSLNRFSGSINNVKEPQKTITDYSGYSYSELEKKLADKKKELILYDSGEKKTDPVKPDYSNPSSVLPAAPDSIEEIRAGVIAEKMGIPYVPKEKLDKVDPSKPDAGRQIILDEIAAIERAMGSKTSDLTSDEIRREITRNQGKMATAWGGTSDVLGQRRELKESIKNPFKNLANSFAEAGQGGKKAIEFTESDSEVITPSDYKNRIGNLQNAYFEAKGKEDYSKLESDAEAKTWFDEAAEHYDTIDDNTGPTAEYSIKYGIGYDSKKRFDELNALLNEKGYDFKSLYEYEYYKNTAERQAKDVEEYKRFAKDNPIWGTVSSYLASPFKGLLSGKEIGRALSQSIGGDIDSYKPMTKDDVALFVDTVRETVSADIEEKYDWEIFGTNVASFAYNTGLSIADSITLASILGPSSSIVMGMNATASASNAAIDKGATADQALWAGITSGAAEMIFEKISVESLFKNVLKGDKGALLKILTQAGVEFSEEAATEVSNIITDAVILGEKSDYKQAITNYEANGYSPEAAKQQVFYDLIGQVALSGVAGAISGGVTGGGGHLVSKVNNGRLSSKVGGELNNVSDSAIIEKATKSDNAKVDELYRKYTETKSGRQRSKIVRQMAFEMGEASEGARAIADKASRSDNDNVRKYYDEYRDAKNYKQKERALGKMAIEMGAAPNVEASVKKTITRSVQKKLEAGEGEISGVNKKNTGAITDAIYKKYRGADNSQLSNREQQLLRTKVARSVLAELQNPSSDTGAEVRNVVNAAKNVSSALKKDSVGAKASNNGIKANEITGVVKDESGNITSVKVGGKQLNVNDDGVSFDYDTSDVLRVMPSGLSEDATLDYLKSYKGQTDAEHYAEVYEVMYSYGSRNLSLDAAMDIYAGIDPGVSSEAMIGAWEQGKKTAVAKAKAAQAKIVRDSVNNIQKSGTVNTEAISHHRLTNRQKNSIEVIKKLAEVTGINFVLYDSKIDKSHTDENGRYENNTIFIDINAGLTNVKTKDCQNAIIGTASHELTHHIKKWSPAKYQILEEFVLSEYGKYKDVNSAIRSRQAALGVSEEIAREELVAECCESMLSDSEGIAKLARRDSSLAKKIVHWLDDYIGKLKKAVKDMESFSDAGRFLNVASDKMQDIRDRWYDALADATDNFNGRSGATTETADDIDVMETVSETTEEVGETVAEVGETVAEVGEMVSKTVDQTVDQTVDDDTSSVNDADMDALIDKVNYAEKYKEKLMKEFSPEEGEFAPDFTEYEEIDYDEDLRPVERSESAKTEYAAATEEELFSFENEERKAAENKKASAEDGEVRRSVKKIIGDSGRDYGIGVYLDSTLLSDLTDDERIEMIKEYVKELGGSVFTAYDNNRNAVGVHIVEANKKFKNKGGRRVPVNRDLTSYLNNKVKQEAIVLIDELISTSSYKGLEPATHPHDWVDNNGGNDWDVWTTYIQDKENTIWDAKLRIANSTNGDKILYDIFPIEMVERSGTSDTISTNNRIAQLNRSVNPSQANSSDNPSTDEDNRSSKRISYDENIGEDELREETEKLKGDVAKLKDLIKLQRSLTHGKLFTNSSVQHAAERIMKNAGIHKDKSALIERLHSYYSSIASAEALDWQTVYGGAADIASEWYNKNHKAPIDEDNMALKRMLHSQRIRLSQTQKSELAAIYGSYNDFHRSNFGRIKISEDGVPLESVLREWADRYPQYFDADTSEGDAAHQLDDALREAYSSDGRVALSEFEKEQAIRDIAMNIYDEYWNISTLRTWEDKRDAEIKQMRVSHNNRMSEIRAKRDETIADLKKHYIEKYNALRDKKNAQMVEQAKKYREKISEGVEARGRKAGLERAEKLTKELITMLSRPTDKKHVPDELAVPLAKFLDSLEYAPTYNYRKDGTVANQKTADAKAERWASLFKDVRSYLKDNVGGTELDFDSDTVAMIDDFLGTVEGLNIYDLDAGQLKVFNQILTSIKKSIDRANTIHVNGRNMALDEFSNAFIENNKEKLYSKSGIKKVENIKNMLKYETLNAFYYADLIGPEMQAVIGNIADGVEKTYLHISEVEQFVRGLKKDPAWKSVRSKKLIPFPVERGTLFLTKGQMLSLYEASKREQAKGHIEGFGVAADPTTIEDALKDKENKSFSKQMKEILGKDAMHMTRADLDLIFSNLTDGEKAFADKVQKFLSETCGAWGNEVSMELFGYRKFTEKHYWPIKSDRRYTNNPDMSGVHPAAWIVEKGFTKGTKDQADNSIIVYDIMDVLLSHSIDMAQYNGLRIPLMDAMRFYKYSNKDRTKYKQSGVETTLEKAYGIKSCEFFKNLIMDLNEVGGDSRMNGDLLGLVRNVKAASVGANLRVAIQQPAAWMKALLYIEPKYMFAGLNSKGAFDRAIQHNGLAYHKSSGSYGIGLTSSVQQKLLDDLSAKDKLIDFGMWLPGKMDEITWGALWRSCELKVSAEQKSLEKGSDEYYEAVSSLFSEVINMTQVIDTPMHRTEMMRSKDSGKKQATAFMSEPMLWAQMASKATRELVQDKNVAGAVKFVGVWAVQNVLLAALQSIPDMFRDDDEYETWFEKYGAAFVENIIDNFVFLNWFPYIKDSITIFQGRDANRMETQVFRSFYDFSKSLKTLASGKAQFGDLYKSTCLAAEVVSDATGVPVSNAMRTFESVANAVLDVFDVEESLRTFGIDTKPAEIKAAFTNGYYDSAKKRLDEYLEQKVSEYEEDGESAEEALKKARSGAKTSITSWAKEEYIKAYWKGQSVNDLIKQLKALDIGYTKDDFKKWADECKERKEKYGSYEEWEADQD